MKALWVSLGLFAVLLGLMISSMVIINRVCDGMVSRLDALPDVPTVEGAEAAEELQAYWKKWRGWVHPAVNHTELNTTTDTLDSLVFYADPAAGEEVEYARMKKLLYNAIDELRRLERIALENIV